MTVRLHLLDAFEEFPAALLDPLRREIDAALATIGALMPIDRVDIVVAPGPWVIPEFGMSGFANSKGRMTLIIDPQSPHLADGKNLDRVLGLIAHELHHVVRQRGPGYGQTLGEALVTEGLAECFEVEAGASTPFYAVDLDPAALARAEERARLEAKAASYDHNAWFFGKRSDPDWPRNAGYSLGFALTLAWLQENDATAVESVQVPAAAILDPWLEGRLKVSHPATLESARRGKRS